MEKGPTKQKERERVRRRRSHHHTHSSMERCELKLRKVQLGKPSEKKALGSSVARSHAWHCGDVWFLTLIFSLSRWFLLSKNIK
jgi:hypothetical protein